MNSEVWKLMNSHKMHQPRADIERLCVKRENVERGLIQLELTHKTIAIALRKYLESTTDWMLVSKHTREAKEKIFKS